jgi:tetratricopeptide (TPR) repeat protein
MAERIEEPDAGPQETPVQDSPAAVAIALGRTSRGPGAKAVDAEAVAFLRDQRRLINIQTEHLHEQRELILSRLRWGRFSDRVKAAIQVMTAFVGLAVVAAVGAMAWSASREHGVVVEAFSVPPDLAARGLNGQVVAGKFLDDLQRMQAQTGSRRSPSTYANNWSGEVKVEIPDTGVSVGELHRLLVDWLGRNTKIEGDVYRTPQGLSVTARAGALPAADQAGAEADLDALIQAAAEDIYRETQPYLYGKYLFDKGDLEHLQRAKAQYQELVRTGSPEDRMWAYLGLADTQRQLGDLQASMDTFTAAAAQYPHFYNYYSGLSGIERGLEGHDEKGLADLRTAREMLKRYSRSYMRPGAAALSEQLYDAGEAELHGDYAKGADAEGRSYDRDPTGGNARLSALVDLALDHASLAAVLARAPNPRGAFQTLTATADEDLARLTHAFAMGDWAGVENAYDALDTSQLRPNDRLMRSLMASPYAAIAEARLGQSARAQALIATTPQDCNRCADARGVIASAAGDWAGADRWFAEAERLAPSLPFAYADQAQSRLARGDTVGAIALLQTANAKGPHYADALELWGEALARRGDYAGAIARYAEADRYAPQWGRNHLMWAEALAKSGRTAEARAQKDAAAGLELTAADRGELNGLRI